MSNWYDRAKKREEEKTQAIEKASREALQAKEEKQNLQNNQIHQELEIVLLASGLLAKLQYIATLWTNEFPNVEIRLEQFREIPHFEIVAEGPWWTKDWSVGYKLLQRRDYGGRTDFRLITLEAIRYQNNATWVVIKGHNTKPFYRPGALQQDLLEFSWDSFNLVQNLQDIDEKLVILSKQQLY